MTLKTTKLDIWAAEIEDRPGGLARVLRTISDSGADLECVLARRDTVRPGKGTLFVTPLTGKEQFENAKSMGLHRAEHIATLKIEGDDHPGLGADLARVIGEAGVSLHGLTATSFGNRFVCYASFDSELDIKKAEQALQKFGESLRPRWKDLLHRKDKEKTTLPA